MPGENVTVLHLFDLQFGKSHRFAGVDLTGLTNPYDTSLSRFVMFDCFDGTRFAA